jgi:hypothetical protein
VGADQRNTPWDPGAKRSDASIGQAEQPALAVPAPTTLPLADRTDRTDTCTTPDRASVRPVVPVERTVPVGVIQVSDVANWLRARRGQAATSMRRLAAELDMSPSGVHEAVRRAVTSGVLTAVAEPRGTQLALVSAGRPN